jgi:hypothetical protein
LGSVIMPHFKAAPSTCNACEEEVNEKRIPCL